jgi:hypothetical protein
MKGVRLLMQADFIEPSLAELVVPFKVQPRTRTHIKATIEEDGRNGRAVFF